MNRSFDSRLKAMRRGGAWVLVLLCVSLGGCLTGEPVRPSTWLDRLRSPRLPLGPDGVVIQMVLLERPLGDPFLNEEIWQSTDCQTVGPDRKAILDDNGIRVGQVVGMIPARLQAMLHSERYWAAHRMQIKAAGQATAMPLGQTLLECSFQLRTMDGGVDVLLEDGLCNLLIEPTLARDGRVKLKFTPQVLYGTRGPEYQVDPSRGAFQLEFKRPSKTYPELAWEVTLAANQFLVIGSHFDPEADEAAPQTLGGQFFIQENDRTFVQRLLVLRTVRGADGDEESAENPESQRKANQPAPATAASQCLHDALP
jgi:hypothetical protein